MSRGLRTNVHATIGDERTLRRIMALLIALAALAERAAGRSYPVRCLVLWILGRAEAVARDFVADATGMPPAVFAVVPQVHGGPADALRLAARLAALAAALGALLPVACRLDRRPSRPGGACVRNAPPLGLWTRKPHDTS